MRRFHRHPPRSHPAPDPISVTGHVEQWTYNHRGHQDGFLFADGTPIRFPPHRAHDVREFFQLGDEITVFGNEHTPPDGDTHIDAHTIHTPRGHLRIEVAAHPIGDRLHVTNAPILENDVAPIPRAVGDDIRFQLEARLASVEAMVRELHDRVLTVSPDSETTGTHNAAPEIDA